MTSSRFARSAAAALLTLTVATARATTYWVAQEHPAAVDASPGTEAAPWKTISRALRELKPGDTLWVRAGVYREAVILPKEEWPIGGVTYPAFPSGKSVAQPIRFLAQPGEQVTITGSDPVAGWSRHKDNIWLKDNWAINSQQVFCDGEILQQTAGNMVPGLQENWSGRKGDSLADLEAGSFFWDGQQKKLYVWLKDGGDPNAHQMEVSVRPFLFTCAVDYVHISGFRMTHSNTTALVNWPAVQLGGNHNTMEDCELTWTDFVGLGVSGSRNTVVRCRVNHHGDSGLGGSGWGHQILDSQFAFNNYRRFNAGWHAGGLKIIPFAHAWVVSGCVVEDNIASDGLWFDAFNANVTIQNNICRRNDGSGIHYEISERAIIRNNVCYENKGRGIYLSNSSNSIVLHNLCYRNGSSGIVSHGVNRRGGFSVDPDTGYEPARNNVIWGNILMDNCHPELCPKGADHTGNTWEKRPELIVPDPAIASNRGCVSDYNLFFRSDGRPIMFWENWGGGIYKDLAEWSAKTGQDRHSKIAEPRFVDLAARDFHPAKGSPAIQLVRPTMSIHLDYDGRLRPIWQNVFLTAGPFEAPEAFLDLPKTAAKPAEPALRPLPLPDAARELPSRGDLGKLAKALKSLPLSPRPDGQKVVELQGTPFALTAPATALTVSRDRPRVLIPVNCRVRELHLLHALVGPATTGVQSRCVILRQDGMALPLRWELGKNIAPSLGRWEQPLTEELSAPIAGWFGSDQRTDKTRLAWEGKAGSTPVRLFLTTWKNENEWLPVKEIEWVVENPEATVVLVALSANALD